MTAVFKRDLRSYFNTPLGYVFIVAMLLVIFINFLLSNVNPGLSDLSNAYSFVLFLLIFATPILTMRLFSEEYKQKTDQLLLTAPVKVWEIVTGKFLAALALFACVLAIALILPLIVAIFGTLNISSVIGNNLALLFAAAAFISIGMFMSALTENQLVSALLTLGTLLVMYILDAAAFSMKTGWLSRLGELIPQLSLFRRFQLFSRGIFSLPDILFYCSVCAFFLFLTARALEKKRWA